MMLKPGYVMFISDSGNGIGKATGELANKIDHNEVFADFNREAARAISRSLGEKALPLIIDVHWTADWNTGLEEA
jgi:hypothetical protein